MSVDRRRARVRLTRNTHTSCPGAPGHVRHWMAGTEVTLWQISTRPGAPLDEGRDPWWTDFDVDLAHILPADAVEVVRVLEERTVS